MTATSKDQVLPATGTAKASPWWLWPVVALVVLTVLVSGSSLTNGFVTDDEILIRQNRDLESWGTVYRGFTSYLMLPWVYRPMIFLSFFLDKQLWGLAPLGYHLTNLAYHAGMVLLVFFWGSLVLGRRAALAGGLLFAVLPVHSESVSWIAGRSDVICGFWYLLALYLGSYALVGRGPRPAAYWGSVGGFAVAMLTKEMSATLPVVLALGMLAFNLPQWAPWRRRLGMLAPYLAVLALYLVARRLAIGHFLSGPFPNADILATAQATPLIVLWYLWLLVQPGACRLYYQIPAVGPVALAGCGLAVAGLAGALAYAWRRRREWSYLGWWFLVAMAPVAMIPTDPRLADHYIYLPSVGFALLAGALGVAAWDWAGRSARAAQVAMAAAGIGLLVSYGWISALRNGYWKDSLTFYGAMAAQQPEVTIAHVNLGVLLFGQGQHEEAFRHWEIARRQQPRWPEVLNKLAGGHYELRQYDRAIEIYQQVLELEPSNALANSFLPRALLASGRLEEAVETLLGTGRAPEALGVLLSRERDPQNGALQRSLGMTYARLGRFPEAEQAYRRAVQAAPDDYQSLIGLGAVLQAQGKLEAAMAAWQQALRRSPEASAALYLLGQAYEQQGKRDLARQRYQQYLEVDPHSLTAARVRERLSRLAGSPPAFPSQP